MISILERSFFYAPEYREEEGLLRRRCQLDIIKKYGKPNQSYFDFGFSYFDDAEQPAGYMGYYFDGRYHSSIKRFVEYFELRPDSNILDFGCAKGTVVRSFVENGFKKVVGVDASAYAIENCVPGVQDNLFFIENNELPFATGSIDFVICKEVLPHVPVAALPQILSELNRVCNDAIYIEIQTLADGTPAQDFFIWDPTHQIFENKKFWVENISTFMPGKSCFLFFKPLV